MKPTDAIALLEEINAAAEADMLAGNPVTGAHHRAIERKLTALREERERPVSCPECGEDTYVKKPGEWVHRCGAHFTVGDEVFAS
jgi:hypothetical protein